MMMMVKMVDDSLQFRFISFRTISAKFMDNTPAPPPGYYPPPQQPIQNTNPGNGGNAGGNPQLLQDPAALLNIQNSKY